MTDTIARFFRYVLLFTLGLVGLFMALVFMISSAIAVGILYVWTRLRGRPFGVKAYWQQRSAGRSPQAQAWQQPRRPYGNKSGKDDIIDVQVRDLP